MARLRPLDFASSADQRALASLLATATVEGCARHNSDRNNAPVSAHVGLAAEAPNGSVVGYGAAELDSDVYVIDSFCADDALHERLLLDLLASLPPEGQIEWWTHERPANAAIASAIGLRPHPRKLLNMRGPLPFEAVADRDRIALEVRVRPYQVGVDDQAWLRVNNAAFSWHGEQGDWNLDTLAKRFDEPWFDPAGLLVHERDGELAAFCWTKVHVRDHAGSDNHIGEIFVIAVDPRFHGLGLGRALTVAGLRHLGAVGCTTAMLYVEANNYPAIALYQSLGLQVAHTDLAFSNASATGDMS